MRALTLLLILITANSAILADEPITPENEPFVGRPGKVVKATGWPGQVSRVVAVAYDYTQHKQSKLSTKGKLHPGIFKRSAPLTQDQVKVVFDSITGDHDRRMGAMCFMPHHGFVFYDKNDQVLGSLSLCFMCNVYQAEPQGELSRYWDMAALAKLIKELKLPIYENSKAYTAAYQKAKKAGALN